MITNDIEKVSETTAIYAALLTPQGKFLFDFFIVEYKDRLLLDCEAARIPGSGQAPDHVPAARKGGDRPQIERLFQWARCSRQRNRKPQEREAPQISGSMACTISIRGTRALGTYDPPDRIRRHSLPADEAVLAKNRATYEAKRISLGIPSGTDLIPEKSLPLEAGFDELNGVDFEKGCYVGQEVTARMKHRGLVKKRMFPVTFEEELASGTPVKSAGVGAGEILSAENGHGIALLRLDLVNTDYRTGCSRHTPEN